MKLHRPQRLPTMAVNDTGTETDGNIVCQRADFRGDLQPRVDHGRDANAHTIEIGGGAPTIVAAREQNDAPPRTRGEAN